MNSTSVESQVGYEVVFYKLQADYIAQKSKEKSVPVIAFVEDMAASGGYWLATAAPTIYVSQSSLVGSIGVISQGFGFHETIAKLGKYQTVWRAHHMVFRIPYPEFQICTMFLTNQN